MAFKPKFKGTVLSNVSVLSAVEMSVLPWTYKDETWLNQIKPFKVLFIYLLLI